MSSPKMLDKRNITKANLNSEFNFLNLAIISLRFILNINEASSTMMIPTEVALVALIITSALISSLESALHSFNLKPSKPFWILSLNLVNILVLSTDKTL